MPTSNQNEDYDLVFRPVWQCNADALDLFRCIPLPTDNDDPLLCDGSIEASTKNMLGIIDGAFTALTHAASQRSPFRLIIPINSACLVNDSSAAKIVSVAKKLNPILRKAVIFEVLNFPENLTLDYLDDATIPLMPFFDHFIAVPDLSMKDFTVFSNCNYFAVSLNLDMDTEKVKPLIEGFCKTADLSRLKIFIHGVSTKDTAELARTFVIEGIDGGCYGKDITNLSETPKKATFN